MDCVIRFRGCNDVELYTLRIPAACDAPELCLEMLRCATQEGRGECRVPVAPAASCAKVESTRVSHHEVAPGSPGIPARNGFNGLLRALPGDRAFLSPSPADRSLSSNLTPASRRQDHTTSPSASAPFVKSASASTASRPTFVTIAKRPFWSGRDDITIIEKSEVVKLISEETEYLMQIQPGAILNAGSNPSSRLALAIDTAPSSSAML